MSKLKNSTFLYTGKSVPESQDQWKIYVKLVKVFVGRITDSDVQESTKLHSCEEARRYRSYSVKWYQRERTRGIRRIVGVKCEGEYYNYRITRVGLHQMSEATGDRRHIQRQRTHLLQQPGALPAWYILYFSHFHYSVQDTQPGWIFPLNLYFTCLSPIDITRTVNQVIITPLIWHSSMNGQKSISIILFNLSK